MTPDRIAIRRERTVAAAHGRGLMIGNHWVVRSQPHPHRPATTPGHRIRVQGPRLAAFPTFEEARAFAADWVDARAAATEPTC